MKVLDQIKAARRVSTPLIFVNCPDPAATIDRVTKMFENGAPIPFVRWDMNSGLTPLNAVGKQALVELMGADESAWPGLSANPGTALGMMLALPGERREGNVATGKLVRRGVMVFMLNPQMLLTSDSGDNASIVTQGIWNLRDPYKGDRRTLLMLGVSSKLPSEIAQDVIVFDEPLPDEQELTSLVSDQLKSSGLELKAETLAAAVDAVRGLPAFASEQIAAMSVELDEKFNPVGMDVQTLWQRKIAAIEQIAGLEVDRGEETFDVVGGLENFKQFGLRLIRSKRAPMLYVRIDEIEKYLGGLGSQGGPSDNTGISQDRLGVILRCMEDYDWNGLIALGHAGTGKSLVTKSLANTATKITGKRVLSISMDLGATTDKKAGESEARIRALMNALLSLGGRGKVFFVATCNDLDVMPPALKRRFRRGTWMFDLPAKAEREEIWRINLARYGLDPASERPADENWTGADIRNVCETADALECSLEEAKEFVVIVANTDPQSIDVLRRKADGKYLSANQPGIYRATLLGDGFEKKRGRLIGGSEDDGPRVVGVIVATPGGQSAPAPEPPPPTPEEDKSARAGYL